MSRRIGLVLLVSAGMLTAVAVGAAAPPQSLELSEHTLDFGRVPLGQGVGRTLVFYNRSADGVASPQLIGTRTYGPDGDAFFVDANQSNYGLDGCPNVTTLQPGGFCLFLLSFAPVDEKRKYYRGAACFATSSGRDDQYCVTLIGRLDSSA